MTIDSIDSIIGRLDLTKPVLSPVNLNILSKYSLSVREAVAFKSKMMCLYLGDEVKSVKDAEESACLKAIPVGMNPTSCNILNVGAGDRLINSAFFPIDAFREKKSFSGIHASTNSTSFLSLLDNLPFRQSSVDAILSLHSLEHIASPVETVLHWIDCLKPGGGIGLILPDWRYTYSARNDRTQFGHKWNPEPSLILDWYNKYWKDHVDLEYCDSYLFKISFDVVLRKKGKFRSFESLISSSLQPSGYELNSAGHFPNDIY